MTQTAFRYHIGQLISDTVSLGTRVSAFDDADKFKPEERAKARLAKQRFEDARQLLEELKVLREPTP